MRTFSLSHLDDDALLRHLKSLVARDRATTALLIAHIGEVDARRLFAPAGYSSMFAYCVEDLRLSEDEAYKRLTVARAARAHPLLLEMLAEGRLHLTAARLLAPRLTPENYQELLAAAEGRSAAEIEALLAARFGPKELPARLRPVGAVPTASQAPIEQAVTAEISTRSELVSRPVAGPAAGESPAGPDAGPASAPMVPATPLPGTRYRLEVTIEQSTHDKLRRLQALLRHSVPTGDIACILDRAFDALIIQAEGRKFAATPRPRPASPRPARSASARRLAAAVRRAVWARDEGRCTFVAADGQRCQARGFLEFDHARPRSRGGPSTVGNLRLRCRAHNQLEAERVFGRQFMAEKRAAAGRARPRVDGRHGRGRRTDGTSRARSRDPDPPD